MLRAGVVFWLLAGTLLIMWNPGYEVSLGIVGGYVFLTIANIWLVGYLIESRLQDTIFQQTKQQTPPSDQKELTR